MMVSRDDEEIEGNRCFAVAASQRGANADDPAPVPALDGAAKAGGFPDAFGWKPLSRCRPAPPMSWDIPGLLLDREGQAWRCLIRNGWDSHRRLMFP